MTLRSSRLAAADRLVKGVLPPFTEVSGVVVVVADDPFAAAFAEAFAAFSARRFCLDAEGGIATCMDDQYTREKSVADPKFLAREAPRDAHSDLIPGRQIQIQVIIFI